MYCKIVQSGKIIEVYEYQKSPHFLGVKKKGSSRGVVFRKRRFGGSVQRARKSLKGIILSNLSRDSTPALVTLTMFEHLSVATSWQFVTRFFARLRKEHGSSFRYIAVIEFQKSGRVHYHCLVWGFPDSIYAERSTRYLQSRWLRGFVDCVRTDGSSRISGYLTKYLTKSMQDVRIVDARAYSCSRNCLRPVSASGGAMYGYLEEFVDGDPEHEMSYDTQFLGRCRYRRWSSLDK